MKLPCGTNRTRTVTKFMHLNRSRPVLKLFVAWIVLAIAIGTVAGSGCLKYYRLCKNGAPAEGVVQEKLPHSGVAYSFAVNGQLYTGSDRAGLGTPPYGVIGIGDRISIAYLPNTPTVNCSGDPCQLYSNDLTPALIVSLLFPTLIVCVLVLRSSRK